MICRRVNLLPASLRPATTYLSTHAGSRQVVMAYMHSECFIQMTSDARVQRAPIGVQGVHARFGPGRMWSRGSMGFTDWNIHSP